MNLLVKSPEIALWGEEKFRCATGRNGGVSAQEKVEGDKKTPFGSWPVRGVFYRSDRLECPDTVLPIRALTERDGWCDAPEDPAYNRHVDLPYPASAENLWREDHVYDIIVVLGYNDSPPEPGKGSAIFLHVARDGYIPTDGCVALSREDLLMVLEQANENMSVIVQSW